MRKVVSGSAKDYLYDGASHALAELVGGVWQRAEIYVGGRHLGTYSGGGGGVTSFSHTDWLGTERVRTNVSGVVSETCTSNPYGDALSCAGTDVSPIHYTGLERDTETNLDHAWFRYYNRAGGPGIRGCPTHSRSLRMSGFRHNREVSGSQYRPLL